MESRHTPIERPPMLGFKQSEIIRISQISQISTQIFFFWDYLVGILAEIDFSEVLSGLILMNEILATKKFTDHVVDSL